MSTISPSIPSDSCVNQLFNSMTNDRPTYKKKKGLRSSMIVFTNTPSTWKAEVEEWSRVWGQPGWHTNSSIVRVIQLELFSKTGNIKKRRQKKRGTKGRKRRKQLKTKIISNNLPCTYCFSASLLLGKILHTCHTLLLPPHLCSTYLEQIFPHHSTQMALIKISNCIWFSKVSWLFSIHILLITQPDWLLFPWNTFCIKCVCSDLPLMYLQWCQELFLSTAVTLPLLQTCHY